MRIGNELVFPIFYVLITLLGAAVTANVGYLTWKRRGGKPGAAALTGLIWLFALWGFLYAVELGAWSSSVVDALYETRAIVFLAVAPLWSILSCRAASTFLRRPVLLKPVSSQLVSNQPVPD